MLTANQIREILAASLAESGFDLTGYDGRRFRYWVRKNGVDYVSFLFHGIKADHVVRVVREDIAGGFILCSSVA